VHPDGKPLAASRKPGVADRVDHSLAQLNHYQPKSRADFDEKMRRGRAGKAANDPSRYRDDPDRFFRALDDNRVRYDDVDASRDRRMAVLAEINKLEAAAATGPVGQAPRVATIEPSAGEHGRPLRRDAGRAWQARTWLRRALPFVRRR
jgi:hypothetical protein